MRKGPEKEAATEQKHLPGQAAAGLVRGWTGNLMHPADLISAVMQSELIQQESQEGHYGRVTPAQARLEQGILFERCHRILNLL